MAPRFKRSDPKYYANSISNRRKNFQNLAKVIEGSSDYNVSTDPRFDALKKAEKYTHKANQFQSKASAQRLKNQRIKQRNKYAHRRQKKQSNFYNRIRNTTFNYSSPNYTTGKRNSGGSGFNKLVHAIGQQESGGNYSAVNSSSGALGKYQVMPGNVASWSKKALGYSISPSQFLHSPQLQERVARHQLQSYYKKYGAGGAASAWYSGSPTAYKHSGYTSSTYPSIPQYVREILSRM